MQLRLTRTQAVLVASVICFLVLIVGVFIFFRRENPNQTVLGGQLTVWGVFDSAEVFDQVFAEYRKKHPQVQLSYVEKNPANYEAELLNALASPNPPDVFMFHNSWLPKHADKIQPLLPSLMTFDQFRTMYPEVVTQDFAPDGTIYALPLYLDSLALYYNQDIFDQKGIANPPRDWSEFQRLVPRLREVNPITSRIERAASAIGGSNRSVNRMADIISLLMLQAGTKMVTDDFRDASFASAQGLEALNFYLDFANPASPYYTWNDVFSYSLDAFAQGDAAMMFSYHYQSDLLKQKNPFLNFRIAPMLQPQGATRAVNYANYWGFAVGLDTLARNSAWSFVKAVATDPEVAGKYLALSGRPPAPRSLIEQKIDDPKVGIFAKQALTARTWPQIDSAAVDNAFSKMVEAVASGRPANQALGEAEATISALMNRRGR